MDFCELAICRDEGYVRNLPINANMQLKKSRPATFSRRSHSVFQYSAFCIAKKGVSPSETAYIEGSNGTFRNTLAVSWLSPLGAAAAVNIKMLTVTYGVLWQRRV